MTSKFPNTDLSYKEAIKVLKQYKNRCIFVCIIQALPLGLNVGAVYKCAYEGNLFFIFNAIIALILLYFVRSLYKEVILTNAAIECCQIISDAEEIADEIEEKTE